MIDHNGTCGAEALRQVARSARDLRQKLKGQNAGREVPHRLDLLHRLRNEVAAAASRVSAETSLALLELLRVVVDLEEQLAEAEARAEDAEVMAATSAEAMAAAIPAPFERQLALGQAALSVGDAS